MQYEDAQWLVDVILEPYLSARHTALQISAASFIAHYDLENWDAEAVRETFTSYQFRLRIMEIRRRLSRDVYKEEHADLKKTLDETIAAARQMLIDATEDPRLQFRASRG